MHEGERVLARQHLYPRQPAGDPRGSVRLHSRHGGSHAQRPAVAQDRHRRGKRPGLRRHPLDTSRHAVPECGYGRLPHRLRCDRGLAIARDGAQKLAQVERVAGARLAEGAAHLAVRVGDLRAHDLRHRRRAQGAGGERERLRVGTQIVEQLSGRARLGRAQGQEQRDGQVPDPAGQVAQRAQRRLVSPVQVVDHDEQGLPCGEVRRHPVERVENGEARFRARARALGVAGGTQDPPRGSSGAREQPLALALRRGGQHRLEEAAHDTEGEAALELRAAGAQHAQAPLGGERRARCQQGALSRAGGRFHEHRLARGPPSTLDHRAELSELRLSFEQVRVIAPRHARPPRERKVQGRTLRRDRRFCASVARMKRLCP